MRIHGWNLGRVLQLPDETFGRRFLISCRVQGGDASPAWDISEIGLPEKAVIWELRVFCDSTSADLASLRVALGDQVPASAAMMTALEPLMPGLGAQGADPRAINVSFDGRLEWTQLRFPLAAGGRRLVVEATGAAGKTPIVTVGVVVSGLPKEFPGWLIWDQDRPQS